MESLAALVVIPIRSMLFRRLSLPKIKSVRIDGAALQERASLGCRWVKKLKQ